jgi:hypothetical protein
MRTKFLALMVALACCACAGTNTSIAPNASSPSAEASSGPRIVAHETVDWTSLNSIKSIVLENLPASEDGKPWPSAEKPFFEKVELQFYPRQKYISFLAVPFLNGSLDCTDRGARFPLMEIASPGATVSDRITCQGFNFSHYSHTLVYETTASLRAGMLTIDGKAHIQEDNSSLGRSDITAETHGTIQISGAGCRLISWRFEDKTVHADPDLEDHTTSVVSTPTAKCSIVRDESPAAR